jgi:hypothetical protein
MIPSLKIRSSTPGSYAAQLAGCTCDAKRNQYGAAVAIGRHWSTDEKCPLHATVELYESLPHRVKPEV